MTERVGEAAEEAEAVVVGRSEERLTIGVRQIKKDKQAPVRVHYPLSLSVVTDARTLHLLSLFFIRSLIDKNAVNFFLPPSAR